MSILYADDEGNIGLVPAVTLPRRRWQRPPDVPLDARDEQNTWDGFVGPLELPSAFNPARGFLVSCNNVPVRTDTPIGYFLGSSDRLLRITQLLAAADKVTLDDAKEIQRDVYSITDAALRDLVIEKATHAGLRPALERDHPEVMSAMLSWDGRYAPDSVGAVAFQTILHSLANAFYASRYPGANEGLIMGSAYTREFLKQDLQEAEADQMAGPLVESFAAAACTTADYPQWGDMHRLRLAHPFSNIPLVGDRYRFGDYPAPGGNDTVRKTAHGLSDHRNYTRYGTNSRHICDLSNPDENLFVLIGGQDGWLNSQASLDQWALFQQNLYVRVPLRLETVRSTATHKTELTPSAAP
jgi:penicillin amidase